MSTLLKEIRQNPLLWTLAFVPIVLIVEKVSPTAHTLCSCLLCWRSCRSPPCSVRNRSVAQKTGDASRVAQRNIRKSDRVDYRDRSAARRSVHAR